MVSSEVLWGLTLLASTVRCHDALCFGCEPQWMGKRRFEGGVRRSALRVHLLVRRRSASERPPGVCSPLPTSLTQAGTFVHGPGLYSGLIAARFDHMLNTVERPIIGS